MLWSCAGLYAPQAMAVARRELAWECDYNREAACARRFQLLLGDSDPVFYVPEVISHLSTKRVLTTELVSGMSLDRVEELSQDHKDYVRVPVVHCPYVHVLADSTSICSSSLLVGIISSMFNVSVFCSLGGNTCLTSVPY